MTVSTAAQLLAEIAADLPSANPAVLTAASLRTVLGDMVASLQANPTVNAQTGTSYAGIIGDLGKLVTLNNASPVGVTLPQATGSFAVFSTLFKNLGAGVATITPTTSTINGGASAALPQNYAALVVADGANYQAILLPPISNTGQLNLAPTSGEAITVNLNSAALQVAPSGATFAHFQGKDTFSNQVYLSSYGLAAASHNAVSHLLFSTARGTAASPSAVGTVVDLSPNWQTTLGDYFGFIGGAGYDGAAYNFGASIAFRPAELQVSGAGHGAGIMFGVTPLGGAANAGTYAFWMHPNGYFVVNQNTLAPPTPNFATTGLQLVSVDGSRIVLEMYGSNSPVNLVAKRAGGGLASPNTAVAAGSTIFNFSGNATNGTAFVANATFNFVTDNLQSGTDSSTYMSVFLVAKTSATLTEAFRLYGSGCLSIGAANAATDLAASAVLATDLYSNDATFLIRTKTTLTNSSAGNTATLTNAPAVGNPTKWFSIDDNGTSRKIPAW